MHERGEALQVERRARPQAPHQTPKIIEVRACAPWLRAEIEAVRPRVVILLGATAAKSVLGPSSA